ncbi:MAG: ATPase, partial [Hyphomicrobiales bacterium]|nr:ATPase [Hyphomicrobiales bacterium]
MSKSSVGSVIAVNGSRAKIALDQSGSLSTRPEDDDRLTVGRILKINTGRTEVLGMISAMRMEELTVDGLRATRHVVEAELVGEIMPPKFGKSLEFRRGVGNYPTIGDKAFLVNGSELETAYNRSYSAAVNIGSLQQDDSVPAIVDANG